MVSQTVSPRRTPGFLSRQFINLPGIALGVGVFYVFSLVFIGPMPTLMVIAALTTSIVIPGVAVSYTRLSGPGQWLLTSLIIIVTLSVGCLGAAVAGLLLHRLLFAIHQEILAGILMGLPGLVASSFVLWGMHRIAGRSSPWLRDDE